MAKTPFSDMPKGSRQRLGMKPVAAGVILIVLIGLATYFAFTKNNPFANPYELNAVFKHAHEIKVRSPVRIAGVRVGTVTGVEANYFTSRSESMPWKVGPARPGSSELKITCEPPSSFGSFVGL